MREIAAEEVYRLNKCIRELSAHHNRVSVNFKGSYPSRPYEKTLELFKKALLTGASHIAVIDGADGDIAGFCKADISGENGKLDYLAVREKYRGRGCGKALMDWAMACFDRHCVHHIEVKVVDGNDAIRLYERYGFKINAHILVNSR